MFEIIRNKTFLNASDLMAKTSRTFLWLWYRLSFTRKWQIIDINCCDQLLTVHTASYWFFIKVYQIALMLIHLIRILFFMGLLLFQSTRFILSNYNKQWKDGVFLFFWNSETSLVCLKRANHFSHEILMCRTNRAIFTVQQGSLESQSCCWVACDGRQAPEAGSLSLFFLCSSLFTHPQIIFGSSLTKINGRINIYWTSL